MKNDRPSNAVVRLSPPRLHKPYRGQSELRPDQVFTYSQEVPCEEPEPYVAPH